MNKAELIADVATKTGLSKKDSELAVNATFDAITAALTAGEKVQLVGFGAFDVKERGVRIGRNPDANDFVYPANAQGISSKHCSLIYSEGKLYLKDEGSSYGTFLGNGQRLNGQQVVELKVGDKFYLATTNETFIITQRGGI